MELALSLVRKWLVTPMTVVLWLHKWTCLARPVVIVACRVDKWVRLVIPFLPVVTCIAPASTMSANQ